MVDTISALRLSPRVQFVLGTVPASMTLLTAEEQLAILNAAVAELKRYIKYVDLRLTMEQRRALEEFDSMINDRNTTLIADHSRQLGHQFYLDKHLVIHDAIVEKPGNHAHNQRARIVRVVRHEPPYTGLGELLTQDKYLLSALLYGISEIVDDKIALLRDHAATLEVVRDRVKAMHAKTTHLIGQVPRSETTL